MINNLNDTIIAIITPRGIGAVSLIRLSGMKAITLTDQIVKFSNCNKKLVNQLSHTIHLCSIYYKNCFLDKILISLFKEPNSYTGENIVEISCHGSIYIQKMILKLYINKGVRLANPGEFTLRSFMNGKIDLCQAESINDIIFSNSKMQHKLAIKQYNGNFSNIITSLRNKLLNFISLLELELDFSEENIKHIGSNQLHKLLKNIKNNLKFLLNSFSIGSIIKNGVQVVVIGNPNSGKSTLFNSLIAKDRSIVSNIAGTTRDFIEEKINIKGIDFIIIDTAGIRTTIDVIEKKGIEKTYQTIYNSHIVIYVFDITCHSNFSNILNDINKICKKYKNKKIILVANKVDIDSSKNLIFKQKIKHLIYVSAKYSTNIDKLKTKIYSSFKDTQFVKNYYSQEGLLITNTRHYQCLYNSLLSINDVSWGLKNKVPEDLLCVDIKQCLSYLDEIIGKKITNEDILSNIFSKFCIGK